MMRNGEGAETPKAMVVSRPSSPHGSRRLLSSIFIRVSAAYATRHFSLVRRVVAPRLIASCNSSSNLYLRVVHTNESVWLL